MKILNTKMLPEEFFNRVSNILSLGKGNKVRNVQFFISGIKTLIKQWEDEYGKRL